jgi:hypothetical protein
MISDPVSQPDGTLTYPVRSPYQAGETGRRFAAPEKVQLQDLRFGHLGHHTFQQFLMREKKIEKIEISHL